MEIFNEKEFAFNQTKYFNLIDRNLIEEDQNTYASPKFGEIWVCKVPVIVLKNELTFKTMKRPVLVVDDTHEHFIKMDKKNYYVLKITSQEDPYQRIKVKNLEKTGLVKESFIRIELPLKVEKEQFLYRIGSYDIEEVQKITNKVMKKLQKIAKK